MTTATVLDRRFRFGVTTLADPDPNLSPLEAMRLHSRAYSFLASATLGEPVVEGDLLVYPVLKPAVQTKGAAKKSAPKGKSGLEEILGWGSDTATVDDSQPSRWEAIHDIAFKRTQSPGNPLVDSFLIPMA